MRPKPYYLLDPDSKFSNYWSVFICIVLIYTCIMKPYDLAFHKSVMYSESWWFDTVIDGFFLFDMIITFNTFFQNDTTFENIYDRKKIAKRYLYGWFTLDLVSIIPTDIILNMESFN